MSPLPSGFLDKPFAHRALHGPGRPENSREAVQAAVDAGFAIEIDVQCTADQAPVVFHDISLKRLTGHGGTVQTTTSHDLAGLGLSGGPSGAPALSEVLEIVSGRVPLVIEIKDQDGAMGPNVGVLEAAVAREIGGYVGPLAVMSFNPHSVAAMAELAPDVPRGITTCTAKGYGPIPKARQLELVTIPDAERLGAAFISHDHQDLGSPHVKAVKDQGLSVLCWTVKSETAAKAAYQVADQITFESFLPA